MANRDRLRRLTMGDRVFTWRAGIGHAQGSGDCHRCIRLRAWGSARTGRALAVDLLSTAWSGPWGACATDGSHPTPTGVRAVLTYGLAHGWDPDLRGGTFILTEAAGAGLFVPGFLVTDRLRDPTAADPTARVAAAAGRRRQTLVNRWSVGE